MLIGIGGELESGKSTVANFLVKNHGFTELSFADNLKQMCMAVFNLTEEQCYTTAGKAKLLDNKLFFTMDHVKEISQWMNKVNGFKFAEIDINKMARSVGVMSFTTPREVLQLVGTEICRECVSPSFHVDVVFKQIAKYENVVISDARFANERQAIKDKDGITILVIDKSIKELVEDGNRRTHASETEIGDVTDYDGAIMNGKESLEILERQTKETYNYFKDEYPLMKPKA